MGEKPMVSHADAEASGDPPQQDREQERLPTEYEQGNQSANVKRHHKGGSKPNDGLCKSPVVREDSRHPNTFPFALISCPSAEFQARNPHLAELRIGDDTFS
jgi:hypothetical protein